MGKLTYLGKTKNKTQQAYTIDTAFAKTTMEVTEDPQEHASLGFKQ